MENASVNVGEAVAVSGGGGLLHLLQYGILPFAILIIIVVLVLLIRHKKSKSSFDETDVIICPNCGTVLGNGKNFCTKCGTKIKSE